MRKVVQVGNVIIKRELHVKSGMSSDGLNRFIKSQAFQNELAKDKKLIPQNSSQAIKLLNKTGDSDSEQNESMAQATKSQPQAAAAPKKGAKKASEAPAPAPVKKAAAKKAEVVEEKGPGKIEQILALHKAGKSNKEIVESGFNKTTVSIQVAKYKKAKEAEKEAKKAAKK